MAHLMYSQHHLVNQKPETFMLSTEAQQSLPQEVQVALQQVDNCKRFLDISVAKYPDERKEPELSDYRVTTFGVALY